MQPFRLKHLALKNRILSTAHAPAYAEDGKPKRRYRLYHEEKAKGGIALTMFGGSSNVAPDSPSAFDQIYVGDDSIIPYFRKLAECIHRYDCAIMCQITHMGRRTFWNTGDWLPPIAPSPVREPVHRSFPKEMETSDIRRIVAAYAAARRCREGGLDGCEVLVQGHLIGQFWSPLINRRTDAYGGSLLNRMRFSLEVLDEMRRQVGDDFIVGLRFTADELLDGGLREDEAVEIARAHAATGALDYLNVNGGNNWTNSGLAFAIPGMAFASAPHLHFASRIRREVGLPTFHAGRIVDIATAEHAVSQGHVDMIAMMRAHMADPHLVAKLTRGADDAIRPCVGAGYCIDRIYHGGDALCIHNAATGREETMPHVIAKADGAPRRVVVVAAGPAGLEAARVSAERGHRVVLFEAGAEPGGQVLLAARTDWRKDLIGIVQWLAGEVGRLGADVRFNSYAEAGEVLAEAPDVVIVATGDLPNTGVARGSEHATSAWDILSGQVAPKKSVLVFDDSGQHQGPSTAEFLADRGAAVELVTPDRTVAQEMGSTNFAVHLGNLYRLGVRLSPNLRLTEVAPEGNRLKVRLRNEYSDDEEEQIVDQVVIEHGTLPMDDLCFALKDGASNGGEIDIEALLAARPQALVSNPESSYQLFRIGDAVAGRNIHAAIFDALRLCKDL